MDLQILASTKDEITKQGLEEFFTSRDAAAPTSSKEKDKMEALMQEAVSGIGTSTRGAGAGVSFEIKDPSSLGALKSVGSLVMFKIDIEKEITVAHSQAQNLTVSQVSGKIPKGDPLFVLFAHSSGIVFAYISPGSCKIKEKMVLTLT